MGIAYQCDKCWNLFAGYPYKLEVVGIGIGKHGEEEQVELKAELCEVCVRGVRSYIFEKEFQVNPKPDPLPEASAKGSRKAAG